jgi:hypothetical protein
MTVALVVVGDGRYPYLERCLASLDTFARYPFVHYRIVDDSGRGAEVAYPPGWEVIAHAERRGMAAAVASAWGDLPPGVDYVLHVEEDFLLAQSVPIDDMAMVLAAEPKLAQLVLKRQPWSPEEVRAGGIMEMYPDDYTDRDGWVEHRRIFSLNPCLIPRVVIERGWPAGNEAEFTASLVADGYTFGFWGAREDEPACLHIGSRRSAAWKL